MPAKKYRNCTELTDEMIRAFVEKIVVHKTLHTESGQRTRNIEVHLNFIGNFSIPTKGTEEKNTEADPVGRDPGESCSRRSVNGSEATGSRAGSGCGSTEEARDYLTNIP